MELRINRVRVNRAQPVIYILIALIDLINRDSESHNSFQEHITLCLITEHCALIFTVIPRLGGQSKIQ